MNIEPHIYLSEALTIADDGAIVDPGWYNDIDNEVTVTLFEAIGSGAIQETNTFTFLLFQDQYSRDAELGYTDYPLIGSTPTGTLHSYERWLLIRWSGSYTSVRDFRFWTFSDAVDIPTGWTVKFGTTSTYRPPTRAASSIATNPLPMSDPGTANCGGVPRLFGPENAWSDWIVLQASVDLSVVTEPGPPLGYSDSSPIALKLYLAWVQQN